MLVNFVVLLMVLLGCCALALDIGMFELKRLQLQNAADAAAMGGMLQLQRNDPNWINAAYADGTSNAFTNGVNNTTVTVTEAPSGYYSQNFAAIGATVTQKTTSLFMGSIFTISAQAIALPSPCVYIMGQTAIPDDNYHGASTGVNAYCPMYVHGAAANDAFSTLKTSATYVTGPAGTSYWEGSYYGTPYYNYSPALPDPLAWVTTPAFSACQSGNNNTSLNAVTVTLQPGTYCGGLAATNSNVTLAPGLYIITGGINFQNGQLFATGVTLFLTKGGGSGYGQVQVNGTIMYLGAPTTSAAGGIPGISLFLDRNWVNTASSGQDVILKSMKNYGDGIWYTTTTGMNIYNSSMSSPQYFAVVTDSLYNYLCSLIFSSNYSSLPDGNPFHPRASLVQ